MKTRDGGGQGKHRTMWNWKNQRRYYYYCNLKVFAMDSALIFLGHRDNSSIVPDWNGHMPQKS